MVTNINLVSPESKDKTVFTGKLALLFSIGLLAIVLVAYGIVSFVGKRYSAEQKKLETEIQNEKAKTSGTTYASVADFQERLDLLQKIIEDHPYWDDYLKNFSKYILPDVRLNSISADLEGKKISLKGTAPNYEVLSRQIILLQKFPGTKSVEFKDSNAAAQGGIDFGLEIMIKEEALKKDLSKSD